MSFERICHSNSRYKILHLTFIGFLACTDECHFNLCLNALYFVITKSESFDKTSIDVSHSSRENIYTVLSLLSFFKVSSIFA